jgi:hypothetical protein
VTTSRLGLYNGALRECRERKLASLSENREPRRLLDDVWAEGQGLVAFVLQAKQWKFGRRTQMLEPESSVDPVFGYANAFARPDDLCRICAVCEDERLDVPLLHYQYEGGYWYADIDPIYVTYVSSDAGYGGDFSKWPPNFVLWVETHMASLIAGRLTGAKADRNDLLKLAKDRLKTAANTDAMEAPPVFPPTGTFERARMGGRLGMSDRGSRSRLIG